MCLNGWMNDIHSSKPWYIARMNDKCPLTNKQCNWSNRTIKKFFIIIPLVTFCILRVRGRVYIVQLITKWKKKDPLILGTPVPRSTLTLTFWPWLWMLIRCAKQLLRDHQLTALWKSILTLPNKALKTHWEYSASFVWWGRLLINMTQEASLHPSVQTGGT